MVNRKEGVQKGRLCSQKGRWLVERKMVYRKKNVSRKEDDVLKRRWSIGRKMLNITEDGVKKGRSLDRKKMR